MIHVEYNYSDSHFDTESRKNMSINRTKYKVIFIEVMTRDIAVTPTMHVEDERGRFRRRTMESLSQLKKYEVI